MDKIRTKNRKRLIDTENRLMADRGEKCWGLGEEGEGIEKYKLVVKK